MWAEAAPGPMFAALAIGLVPGAVFVQLRIEAHFGGRGDRFLTGTPAWLLALPWGGGAGRRGDRLGAAGDVRELSVPGAVAYGLLFVNYLIVGVLLLRTQLARRVFVTSRSTSSGWSAACTATRCGTGTAARWWAVPRGSHARVPGQRPKLRRPCRTPTSLSTRTGSSRA
jgi:hypothetical protein